MGSSPLQLRADILRRWPADLFAEAQIGAADHLLRNQQPGGGWPITWEPPSEAATLEWRGVVTLQALRTLTSYGRVSGAQARATSD